MPYSYPNDIPDQIKNLPAGAQKIWVATFNSVLDSGKSEDTARKAAWSQVKAKYKKNKDGKWVKKSITEMENKMSNQTKNTGMKMSKEISNNTKEKGFFKAFIPLEREDNKVSIFTKEVDGSNIKYLRGSASNTEVDKEDDVMTKEFIQKMKSQVLGMTVFSEHKHTIEKTLGFVDSVSGDDDNMVIDTILEPEDSNELVEKILKKIDFGIKIGYSVGGRVTKAVKEFNKDLGRTVRKVLDGEIYEISVTTMPAGNSTWTEPITKSMSKWLDYVEDDFEDKIQKALNSDKKNNFEENTPKSNHNNIEKSSDKSTQEDETTSDKDFSKVLEELMEQEDVRGKIWDLMWAFRTAITDIVENDELTPQTKKEKIVSLGNEFGDKVEALSSQLVQLMETVESQMQTESTS